MLVILAITVLYHVDSTKHLGVARQSDCRFNKPIYNKILIARKQLGMIKKLSTGPPNVHVCQCSLVPNLQERLFWPKKYRWMQCDS